MSLNIPQTLYPLAFTVGIAGQVVDSAMGTEIVSRVVAAGANIPAGSFTVRSSTDGLVKLPTSAAEMQRPEGVALYQPGRRPGSYGSALPDGSTLPEGVPVLRKGRIWVYSEVLVTKGDPVFVRHTVHGGLSVLGVFRNDADTVTGSDTAAQLDGAEFAATTTGSGLAPIDVNLPG